MEHVRYLAQEIGVRVGGTSDEKHGAEYAQRMLESYGYSTDVQRFDLGNGDVSRNVIAEKKGTSGELVVVGAHVDTKSTTRGGNDNASGVGVLLELARDLKDVESAPTVRFVVFGTEEFGAGQAHHYGSRYMAAHLDRKVTAMISLDMVGYGTKLKVSTMHGANPLERRLLAYANRDGGPGMGYLADRGSTGWSDHEPFEERGIPAAWVNYYQQDPAYHGSGDTYGHVQRSAVRRAGRFMLGFLTTGMTAKDWQALAR